ncbi:MAG TPA: DUF3343 domain-containing protein [Candidatus Atribacteria bacterium]|nr:DUF3343 domain-containing protein [Candidatus Atribacteria bacterium]
MKENFSVVIFFSTSAAIRAESLTEKENLKINLIPIPRHLSSDCGVCLRFNDEDKAKIEKILQDEKVEYENIYKI